MLKNKPNKGGIPPEEFEAAFGDGFWDLPVEDRMQMLATKMCGVQVEKVTKEDARRRQQSKEVHNRA